MAEVHGSCDERFAGVRDALAQQLDGDELGASVAVDLDGETVVDVWGGFRDADRTTPWTQDTIVNVWSCTKTVTSRWFDDDSVNDGVNTTINLR